MSKKPVPVKPGRPRISDQMRAAAETRARAKAAMRPGRIITFDEDGRER